MRNPALAAFLAWLIPGAGHLYQRRTSKGILYMVCILGTFFYGLYLGNGKVVYASWRPNDIRVWYLGQLGVGLPALPALAQAYRLRHNEPPLFHLDYMVPPLMAGAKWDEKQRASDDDRMSTSPDELAFWNKDMYRNFELGTIYTVIAGLLNILAICDAFAGPVPAEHQAKDDEPESRPHPAPA